MITQPRRRGHPRIAGANGTVTHRPPLRTAPALARWLAVVALASAGACATVSVSGGAFAPAHDASVLPPAGRELATSAPAGGARAGSSTRYAPNVAIGDSLLRATITRLRRLSPAFDSAMGEIERSGIPVVIGTAVQLRDQLPPGYRYVGGWQALTAVYPLTANGDRGRPIEHVAVIVRLSDLRAALREDGTAADSALFDHYMERVVAHEIYGHLMPQLELGKTAPIACDDPQSAADWYSACVMQRERHVMAELAAARGTFAIAGTH
jgi:hypothetical protein